METRTYGKRLLWAVKAVLRGNRADLDRLMSGTGGMLAGLDLRLTQAGVVALKAVQRSNCQQLSVNKLP